MVVEVNRNPSRSDVRKLGVTVLGGFVVLGAVFWWTGRAPESGLGWSGSGRQWAALGLWSAGAAVLVGTLASGPLGRRIYVGWMTGASWLGAGMTLILLTVLFVAVLPFFALIRLKDPLRLRLAPPGESYWEPHAPHEDTLERTQRPF